MRTFLILYLAVSLFFSGCLTFRQSLVFHRDASCVVTYEYSFPEEYASLWQHVSIFLGSKHKEAGGSFLDEKAVRQFFTENALEVRQYRQYIQDKIRHVEIIVLSRDGEKAINSGIFGDFQLSKNALGDSFFKGNLTPLPTDLSKETRTRLQKLGTGLTFQFRLKVPTEIIQSNGRMLDYQQTEWTYAWPASSEASSIFAPAHQILEATW
ncbi:MAG: hypothetical protein WCT05_02530 [Lentisphaeria bacterium]